MLDAAFIQALHGLFERRLADGEGKVMHAARLGWRAARIGLAGLVGEDRNQPPVAGIDLYWISRAGASN